MAEAGSDGEEVMDEVEQEAQRSRSVTPSASSRPVSAARQRASLGAQKLGLPPVHYTPPTTARLRDHSNLSPRPVSAGSSSAGFFAAAPRRFSPGISEGARASFVASVASAASDLEESVVDVSSASSSKSSGSSSSNLSSFHLGGSPISPAVGSGLPRRRSSSAVPLSPIAASSAEDEDDMAREKAVEATAYTPFSDDAASAQMAEETPEAGLQPKNRRRETTDPDSDATAATRRRRRRQQQQKRPRRHSSEDEYSDRGHAGRRRIPRPVRMNV